MPSKITKRTIKQIGGKSKKNVKKINKKSSGKIQKKINKKSSGKIQKKIMLTKKRLFKKYIGGGTGEKKKFSDVYNKNNKIYIYADVPDRRKSLYKDDLYNKTGVKDTIVIEDILYEISEIKSNKLIEFDKQFVKYYGDDNNKEKYTIIETEKGKGKKDEKDIISIFKKKMEENKIDEELLKDARARLVAEAEPEAEPTPSPTQSRSQSQSQSHSQSQSESNSEENLSSGEEEEHDEEEKMSELPVVETKGVEAAEKKKKEEDDEEEEKAVNISNDEADFDRDVNRNVQDLGAVAEPINQYSTRVSKKYPCQVSYYIGFWNRDIIAKRPNHLFVFSENENAYQKTLQGHTLKQHTTQANIRGETNAFAFVCGRDYGFDGGWRDNKHLQQCDVHLKRDVSRLATELTKYERIVFSSGGMGRGIYKYDKPETGSTQILKKIEDTLFRNFGYTYPPVEEDVDKEEEDETTDDNLDMSDIQRDENSKFRQYGRREMGDGEQEQEQEEQAQEEAEAKDDDRDEELGRKLTWIEIDEEAEKNDIVSNIIKIYKKDFFYKSPLIRKLFMLFYNVPVVTKSVSVSVPFLKDYLKLSQELFKIFNRVMRNRNLDKSQHFKHIWINMNDILSNAHLKENYPSLNDNFKAFLQYPASKYGFSLSNPNNKWEDEDDEGNEEAESRSEEKSKLNTNAPAFEPNSNRLNSSANQKLDTIPEEPEAEAEEVEAAAEELSKKDDEDEEKERQQKINMYENQINNFDDLDDLEKLEDSDEFQLDMNDEQIKEKIEGKIRERRKKIFRDKLNDIDDIDGLEQWRKDSEVDRYDDKELENLLKERQKDVFIKKMKKMDKEIKNARDKFNDVEGVQKRLKDAQEEISKKKDEIKKIKERWRKIFKKTDEEKLKVAKILVQLKGLKKKYKTRKKTEGKNLLKSKKEYKDSFKPFYIKEFYENSDKQEQEKWIIEYLNKNSNVGGKKKKKIIVKKIVRKHRGIVQIGGNKGRLRKGYKFSGKKLKSGLPQIIKCRINKF